MKLTDASYQIIYPDLDDPQRLLIFINESSKLVVLAIKVKIKLLMAVLKNLYVDLSKVIIPL